MQVNVSLKPVSNYFTSEASFSSCGRYRWWLKRILRSKGRTLLYIGLNPSLANAYNDDPTLRRLLGFCDSWGYGKLVVANLFARVSKSPSELRHSSDPIGAENDSYLTFFARYWANSPFWDLWLGWGAGGSLKKRNLQVLSLLDIYFIERSKLCPNAFGPLAIGFTSQGHPRHPLYLPRSAVLKSIHWIAG